jgi:hypothetical protein
MKMEKREASYQEISKRRIGKEITELGILGKADWNQNWIQKLQ